MAEKIKGITIQIGGDTTGLDKALKGVNKESADLQSELKKVDRLLKLDPTNTELLAQKQKLLAQSIETTSSKLDTLKEAQKQAQEQLKQGKISEEQYRALEREITATGQSLDRLKEQAKAANNAFAVSLGEAGKKMEDFGKKTTEIGKKASIASAAVTALGVVAFNAAADMQDAIGATDQVFGKQSKAMQEWADNLESYYGIAEGEALTYANTMGSMLKNIGGLTEEEAAKQSQTLIKLAGDLTAMFGGTTESAVQALTGALKGNNSMLDNYGMAVNEATIKAEAMKMGLMKTGEQMSLSAKQAATLSLIMKQAGDATGQAERESSGASGSLRSLKTELKNVSAELGEVLIPIITPLIQKLSDMIKRFSGLDDGTKKFIVTIGLFIAVLGPVLMVIGSMATGIGAVSGALSKLIPVLMGTSESVGLLSKAMAFLAANPVVLIIAAIVAVIAAFTYFYTTNEKFKKQVDAVIKAVSDTYQKFCDFVVSIFTVLIPNAWNFLVDMFKGGVNVIISAVNWVIDSINAMVDAINSIKVKLPDWMGGQTIGFNLEKVQRLEMLKDSKGNIAGADWGKKTSNYNTYSRSTTNQRVTNNYNVNIDAKNVREFNDVVSAANSAQQQRRAY